MKQVAVVGIQGVPAKYGGFETLVENIIGENCSEEVAYTVYCSGRDYKCRLESYKGAKLKYISLFHANEIQGIFYDTISLLKSLKGYDAILVLGVSACVFLPVFRLFYHKKLIVNIDGLEHNRGKWGKFTKWFLLKSEQLAVRCADIIISDNKGIQDYVQQTYHKSSSLIAYGGDHSQREVPEERQLELLLSYGLEPGNYSVAICRIEPENNCAMVLEAFAATGQTLVFIGNWNRSKYSRSLKQKYAAVPNIRILDSVYDLDILYSLRNKCACYIHAHSAGGTNPSLVEAMFFSKPILAYDVIFNRETTENSAYYFKDCAQLQDLLASQKDKSGEKMKEIALRRYTWGEIARQYEDLY